MRRYAFYAWFVVLYNLGVILWGAYVRATGSGAGCGSHWPLCNGVALPQSPQTATLIEFTHRISSGLALILVIILFVWAYRITAKGHPVRTGATLSFLFIILESLVGAGLVLFEWVAFDQSAERVITVSIHLVNTFLLLAALSLTAWWASGGTKSATQGSKSMLWVFIVAYLLVIFLGISGAITALGDTLFPPSSLVEGFQQDFNPDAHLAVRLRVWHPLIAILTAVYLIILSTVAYLHENLSSDARRFSSALILLIVVQLAAGVTNLVFRAPVWMQIIHLLLADLVWIILVLFGASTFKNHLTKENSPKFGGA